MGPGIVAAQKKFIPARELISLTGKRAMVTGGAQGIGFAIAYRLAEAGAAVALVDTNIEKGEKASRELNGYGYQTCFIPCDVSREEEVESAVKTVVEKMGGIDILVNNAGIFPRVPLMQMKAADFEQVMAVNLKGAFFFIREASQRIAEQQKGGCIINIVSIDALHPSYKGFAAYDASKGALLTMTKSLALELAEYDIRVNAIAPGGIMTEGAVSRVSGTGGTRAGLKEFLSHIAQRRMGTPDDVARVALFLASDLSSYMTGSLVVVDGGYLIS